MQLTKEFIKQAIKDQGLEKRVQTMKIKNKEFPIDENFICPYCSYVSQKNKHGTARIFSESKSFFCFACNERREVKV